jgi:hypothetical protein
VNTNREVFKDEHKCCKPFTLQYGQPALYVFETFLPAASSIEYAAQNEELQALLKRTKACGHVRDIAISTHRTLCGNDAHVTTVNSAWFCGISTEEFEVLMSAP